MKGNGFFHLLDGKCEESGMQLQKWHLFQLCLRIQYVRPLPIEHFHNTTFNMVGFQGHRLRRYYLCNMIVIGESNRFPTRASFFEERVFQRKHELNLQEAFLRSINDEIYF
ncbi:hypothetical protein Y032_0010g1066 [Ancylostoma ceylanicum]|uniref:Uncharacterized protein n=1 Tax=Ancylostoma ceylanicum TaxID=53326 RepID=A0A016VHM6_9BILA|nr:hypothetical protein Y032_0010g1066 [Ancylostoma ceylanicum]